jgi:hypothetical protein
MYENVYCMFPGPWQYIFMKIRHYSARNVTPRNALLATFRIPAVRRPFIIGSLTSMFIQ